VIQRTTLPIRLARPKMAMPALLGFVPPKSHPQLGAGLISDLLGVDVPKIGVAAILAAGGVGALFATKILPEPFNTVAAIGGVGLLGISIYELIDSFGGPSEASKIQSGETVDLTTHPRVTPQEVQDKKVDARFIEPLENANVLKNPFRSGAYVPTKLIVTNDTGRLVTVRLLFQVVEGDGSVNSYHEDRMADQGTNTRTFDAPITSYSAFSWPPWQPTSACVQVRATTIENGVEIKYPGGWDDQRCFNVI